MTNTLRAALPRLESELGETLYRFAGAGTIALPEKGIEIVMRAWGKMERAPFPNEAYGMAGLAIKANGLVVQETHLIVDRAERGCDPQLCRKYTIQLDAPGHGLLINDAAVHDDQLAYSDVLTQLREMEGELDGVDRPDFGDPTCHGMAANYAQIFDMNRHSWRDPDLARAAEYIYRGGRLALETA